MLSHLFEAITKKTGLSPYGLSEKLREKGIKFTSQSMYRVARSSTKATKMEAEILLELLKIADISIEEAIKLIKKQ